MEGFNDEGIRWCGTREELEQWKQHKKAKALKFVEEGYSVEWFPDGTNWMEVYTPERNHVKQPEIRASVKFFEEPSQSGIDNGRISKLHIQARSEDLIARVQGIPYKSITTFFDYDRSVNLDDLHRNPQAQKLYDIVIRELN